MVAPGSSHMSSHSEELKILSVYGKGEGPLAEDGHDTLFTASEVEALNSLSADHSAAKSLERAERLVCREELSVQVGNHLLIQHPNERLPLLQLQHTPLESTHLYDLMSRTCSLAISRLVVLGKLLSFSSADRKSVV